jgi:hypothetical protein
MDSDETKVWARAQEELLQRRLSDVPTRAAIKARLTELVQTDSYSVPRKANGRYFYTFTAAGRPRGQGVIYVQEGLGAEPRLLFDAESRLGEDATISWVSPSPDGRSLAYSVRRRQSRWATLRVLDVTTGADLEDALTGAHTVTGGISWTKDGKGFFYSAFEAPGAGNEQQAVVRNPKIYYHTLSQPQAKDALVLALPNEPNALITHRVTDDGEYIIVAIHDGGGPRNRILYQRLSAPEAGLKTLIPQLSQTGCWPIERPHYQIQDQNSGVIVGNEPSREKRVRVIFQARIEDAGIRRAFCPIRWRRRYARTRTCSRFFAGLPLSPSAITLKVSSCALSTMVRFQDRARSSSHSIPANIFFMDPSLVSVAIPVSVVSPSPMLVSSDML